MNFIKNFFVYAFFISFLCLIQISIFNPIFFGLYTYIYILFVLVYPYRGNRFIFLLLSFTIGFIIDKFMNTGGNHAFSTTISAFFRLKFLQFFDGKNFINISSFSIYELPFIRKTLYIFSLVMTHHLSLFVLEIFKIANFSKIILLKTIFSSIFTTILCIIYFFFRKIKH
ncbi:MAG: hypothetical protein LBQ72_02980 [Flavobacteriales bacterium]|uniref:hypothetical protein n=1 Tax=Blattabacterium sp. (Mastotermes darwiniensis) TaxID=39768 RepID=UPI000231DF36|nr:hypothetical protein [Blattabacterium sp. (Mastotermes darwiniensis)]AER40339.1 hypothetical protein MADAR_011 [Blattabacterium sp. (Mastotermes darwiniensis) str. MADAR]MDR1805143.1 hypothetical protein [Flavobacteriales bacterium]